VGELQTHKQIYQGVAGGTPLVDVTTCYNELEQYVAQDGLSVCQVPSLLPALPITETDVYTSLNGSATNHVATTFDWAGNTTSIVGYDFGQTTLTTQTFTSYGQVWNGTSCATYSTGTINHTPCYSHTMNSSGTVVAATQITYSNTGHPTTTSQWTGTTWLPSTATYNSNGTIATSTTVSGALSTYAYNGTNGCNGLLPTSVTVTGTGLPSGLTTSAQWNCNGAVATQTTDANGQPINYTYNDPFWRITSMTDPLNNVTNYTYSPTTFETVMNFNGTVSTADTLITTDGLARQIFSQTRQGQGSSTFDTVQTTYGWSITGPFTTTSVPYSGTQAQPAPSGTGITTTQDDATSRPISVSNTGGGYTDFTYAQNDVLAQLYPAPSGENPKQMQMQYDGLGRLTSSCAISSTANGNVACGQNVTTSPTNGIVTTTSYTSATGSQTVTNSRGPSNQQQHSVTVDGLGRMIQKVTPEGGRWTYTYDGNTSCPSGYQGAKGQLASVADPNSNLLCYSYDTLNRVTGVNADGTTCRHFYYDNSTGYSGSVPSGVTAPTNSYGRLAEAATDTCTAGTLVTDEWSSYDKDGHVTDQWELTPNGGTYYHSKATFTGPAITAVQLVNPSLYTGEYLLDGEGRWKEFEPASTFLITGVTYNAASRPTAIYLYGTDNDSYTYDPNTGRMTNWGFTVNSVSETAIVNWNPNWSLEKLAIVDGFNSGGTQTCSFNSSLVTGTGYDDLGRLVGSSCGTGGSLWNQADSYDQYDNLTKSSTGFVSWNPTYSPTTNHYACSGCTTDADGNVTNDGTTAYTWNEFSKLKSIDISGPNCGTSGDCNVYDALGRIVEVDSGSTKTEIWYTQLGKTAYMNGSTIKYAYWPSPGGGAVLETGNDGSLYYMHKDWLGNARIVSSLTGHTIISDSAYAAYGERYDIFGSTAQNQIMFGGGLTQDVLAGIYDTPNRELQGAQQGRWLSPDPAGSGWNQYAYANNPLRYVDPLGLWCVWDDGSGHDDDPVDGGVGSGACVAAGGHWDPYDTITNVMQSNGIVTEIDYVVPGGTLSYNPPDMTLEGFDATLNSYQQGPPTDWLGNPEGPIGRWWDNTWLGRWSNFQTSKLFANPAAMNNIACSLAPDTANDINEVNAQMNGGDLRRQTKATRKAAIPFGFPTLTQRRTEEERRKKHHGEKLL